MKLFAAVLTILSCVAQSQADTNTVLCYFESWAQYHSGNGKFTPAQIPANGCTHIVYSFLLPAAGGQLQYFGDDATLSQLVALRNQNPNLKVLAAIGGWGAGSAIFSQIARDAGQRANLVQALADFAQQHQLDGIDLDWEYPGQRDGDASVDKQNFVQFVAELRSKLGWDKLITAAVGANLGLINTAYDVAAISNQLSFINLMTYDYHAAYEGRTGQNSPLYASSRDSDRSLNADASINAWIAAGAPASKLLLGLGFYGHNFQLANNDQHQVCDPSRDNGRAGRYMQQAGFVSYLEICEQLQEGGWTTDYDREQQAVISYNGDQWIGYDNVESIEAKAQYAVSKGLGGVMMWAIDHDDAFNSCGGGAMPLLSAVNRVIHH